MKLGQPFTERTTLAPKLTLAQNNTINVNTSINYNISMKINEIQLLPNGLSTFKTFLAPLYYQYYVHGSQFNLAF